MVHFLVGCELDQICQYVGIEIREEDVYDFGSAQVATENTEES